MNARDRRRGYVVLVVLLTTFAFAASCGDGGGGGDGGNGTESGPPLPSVEPSVFYSSAVMTFVVSGVNLGSAGDEVTVRFTETRG